MEQPTDYTRLLPKLRQAQRYELTAKVIGGIAFAISACVGMPAFLLLGASLMLPGAILGMLIFMGPAIVGAIIGGIYTTKAGWIYQELTLEMGADGLAALKQIARK